MGAIVNGMLGGFSRKAGTVAGNAWKGAAAMR